MELPKDLRLISLKYAGRCRSCATRLEAGERAHWSRSLKKLWCIDCIGGGGASVQVASDNVADGSRNTATKASPSSSSASKPVANSTQTPWQQLCNYAQQCIEAEAAQSLVAYVKENSLGSVGFSLGVMGALQQHVLPPSSLSDEFELIYCAIHHVPVPEHHPVLRSGSAPDRRKTFDGVWPLHSPTQTVPDTVSSDHRRAVWRRLLPTGGGERVSVVRGRRGLAQGRGGRKERMSAQVHGPDAVQWVGPGSPEKRAATMGDRNLSKEAAISANEAGTCSCWSLFRNAAHCVCLSSTKGLVNAASSEASTVPRRSKVSRMAWARSGPLKSNGRGHVAERRHTVASR